MNHMVDSIWSISEFESILHFLVIMSHESSLEFGCKIWSFCQPLGDLEDFWLDLVIILKKMEEFQNSWSNMELLSLWREFFISFQTNLSNPHKLTKNTIFNKLRTIKYSNLVKTKSIYLYLKIESHPSISCKMNLTAAIKTF